jgi:hypothetical protein
MNTREGGCRRGNNKETNDFTLQTKKSSQSES